MTIRSNSSKGAAIACRLQTLARLYMGDFATAFQSASMRLGEARGDDAISACLDDIALFQGQKPDLARANAFLKYAKDGVGENPLPKF